MLLSGLWAAAATGCFAFVFNSGKTDIFWAALMGGAGWIIYLLVKKHLGSDSVGYFAGSFAVGLLAEIFAHILRNPATVYVVPGMLPLVPGGGMYETMHYAVQGDMPHLFSTGFNTLSAAGSIAVGIALASAFTRIISRVHHRYFRGRDKTGNIPR